MKSCLQFGLLILKKTYKMINSTNLRLFQRCCQTRMIDKRFLSKSNVPERTDRTESASVDDVKFDAKTEEKMAEYGEYLEEMKRSSPLNRPPGHYQPPTKEELQWRKPWTAYKDRSHSFLEVFNSGDNERSKIMKLIQADIDLSPAGIRNHMRDFRLRYEYYDQLFNPERHETLGNELAAAHFIIARGGQVKFHGRSEWVKMDESYDYNLPGLYDPDYVVEAIDCNGMTKLRYEGLENMKSLQDIKSLSINGCELIDDWCLDRISGQFYKTLERLDVRNCPHITFRGLEALYKMENLRVLKIDAPSDTRMELNMLLLEEVMPRLVLDVQERRVLDGTDNPRITD